MTFREIDRELKRNGYVLVRVTGSHYQYRKVGNPYPITVPNHRGKDITIGVLKDLEKKAAISFKR